MEYWLTCLGKYATFSGRARRKEYWMFVLCNVVFSLGIGLVDDWFGSGGGLGLLYYLALFLPGCAVTVRRLHDIGKNGWWWLIAFIPVVGSIAMLVFMCTDSEPGDNAYGPNPKE